MCKVSSELLQVFELGVTFKEDIITGNPSLLLLYQYLQNVMVGRNAYFLSLFSTTKPEKLLASSNGAVVRALISHQCSYSIAQK